MPTGNMAGACLALPRSSAAPSRGGRDLGVLADGKKQGVLPSPRSTLSLLISPVQALSSSCDTIRGLVQLPEPQFPHLFRCMAISILPFLPTFVCLFEPATTPPPAPRPTPLHLSLALNWLRS